MLKRNILKHIDKIENKTPALWGSYQDEQRERLVSEFESFVRITKNRKNTRMKNSIKIQHKYYIEQDAD